MAAEKPFLIVRRGSEVSKIIPERDLYRPVSGYGECERGKSSGSLEIRLLNREPQNDQKKASKTVEDENLGTRWF